MQPVPFFDDGEDARRLRRACTTSTPSSTALQVAKGGLLILPRTVTMSPRRGPDRHADHHQGRGPGRADVRESRSRALRQQVSRGPFPANMTRGATVFKMRAAGEPGPTLDRLRGLEPQRPPTSTSSSHPIPWVAGLRMKFTVTKGTDESRSERREWPVRVKPTIDARTTLSAGEPRIRLEGLDSPRLARPAARVRFLEDDHQGRPGSRPARRSTLVLVDGRRQSRQLHGHVLGTAWPVPLGRALAAADEHGSLSAPITVP